MAKKITYVLAIGLLTFFIITPFLSYRTYKEALKEEVFNHLISTRDILKLQIWNYFNERYGDVDVLSRNPVISQAFIRLINNYDTFGTESSQYQKIVNLYQPLMEYYVSDYGYTNIFFIDKDGNVMFSAAKEKFTGSNLLTEEFKYLSITNVFKRGLEEATFEDYRLNTTLNEYTSYFAAPVYDGGKLLGVLIIEIPFSHLDTMLTQRAGMGETGEMYLVGEDNLMRSNSRFSQEPTILTKEVDTEATRDAFDGYPGIKIIKDYRGVPVLSAYTPLNLYFINWVLIVEIDKTETFASIRSVKIKLITIGSIIGVIAIGYLYLTRRKNNHNISESEEETYT